MLVRLLTNDHYYICEECHKAHKRDGREVRLDKPHEHLMVNPIWYGSVSYNCFIDQQRRVRALIRKSFWEQYAEED
jgi:hypothetical protein